jgi:hypothetical protein
MIYTNPATPTNHKLPIMASRDFAELGIDQIVYIKPIKADGEQVFAVFAANGQEMALASDQNSAMAFAIQEDFTPLRVQ